MRICIFWKCLLTHSCSKSSSICMVQLWQSKQNITKKIDINNVSDACLLETFVIISAWKERFSEILLIQSTWRRSTTYLHFFISDMRRVLDITIKFYFYRCRAWQNLTIMANICAWVKDFIRYYIISCYELLP